MRSYTLNDRESSNREGMSFSVLYGESLVGINSNGVGSEEVYELLLSIK